MSESARDTLNHRLSNVRERIAAACARAGRPADAVRLVPVSKTVGPETTALLPALGCAELAENRPQALWAKAAAVPGVSWHFVGHLQRNKIDRTLPLVSLLHSLDNTRLLEALDAECAKQGRTLDALIEVNISRESAKGGFAPDELPALAETIGRCPRVRVLGLMGMAAYSDDPEAARPAFAELRQLRDAMRDAWGLPLPELSMGMSGDFEVGVEEGATLVRVGTTLFEGLA